MSKTRTKRGASTVAELEAMAGEFDRGGTPPRFGKAPVAEKRRHDRALRAAKRKAGRPKVGKGAERIQVTVEKGLLSEADSFARREHISRSELIARGLRLALA